MGLRYEAWKLPWDPLGGGARVLGYIPVVEGSGSGTLHFLDVAGEGRMDVVVDDNFEVVDSIISDTEGSLIRVYDNTTVIHEWLAERVQIINTDDKRIATISGKSLQASFDKWVVYPYDYPQNRSRFPDWIWGANTDADNLVENLDFEGEGVTERQQFHIHASAGTWTITIPSFGTTGTIAWNASAATVATAMEGVAGINSVVVTGAGDTQFDPFVVEFTNPTGDIGQITINEGGLTHSGCAHPPCHSAVITTLRNGSFTILPWGPRIVPNGGPHLAGYDSITVVDDPDLGGPTQVALVNGNRSGVGLAQTLTAQAGAPIYGAASIYTSSTTNSFRIAILDRNRVTLSVSAATTVAANTWTTINLPGVDLPIPLPRQEIIIEIWVQSGASAPANFYIKDVQLFLGLEASNVGEILIMLMDDATLDHVGDDRGAVMPHVDYSSFSATLDSSGAAWTGDVSLNIPFGATYGQAFDAIAALGYEWELLPKASPSGAATHDLNWYNSGNRDDAPTKSITIGQSSHGGSVVKRIPDYTAVIVEGLNVRFREDTDGAAITNYGRTEKFGKLRKTPDTPTLTAYGNELLNFESTNRTAVRFDVFATDTHEHDRPMVDYRPGDSIPMQQPPALAKETRRIQRITYSNTNPTKYTVVGSRVMDQGEAGGWDIVARMWRAFQRRDEDTIPIAAAADDIGSIPTIMVAAANARPAVKAMADIICIGSFDEGDVQAANDEIAGISSGRLVLSEGDFYFTEGGVTISDKVQVQGMGWGTHIHVGFADGSVFNLGSECMIRDLQIGKPSSGE